MTKIQLILRDLPLLLPLLLALSLAAFPACSSPQLPRPADVATAEQVTAKVVKAAQAALPVVEALRAEMVKGGLLEPSASDKVRDALDHVALTLVKIDKGIPVDREEAEECLYYAELAVEILRSRGAKMPELVDSALGLARLVLAEDKP